MGEAEVKRGIAFMSNPRSEPQTVANWSQAQKVEFLRGKMSAADLDEVLRRTGTKADDDVAQHFELEPPKLEQKKTGYGVYALVGAGLLGAITSALFFVTQT